nr:SWI SNF, matrix associated, actin dependent regulator of chromatin, sub d, member 3 [Polyrhizophydium stewartii]
MPGQGMPQGLAQGMPQGLAQAQTLNGRAAFGSGIEAYVPESRLYLQMQEFEKRLDATITRKTLDLDNRAGKVGSVPDAQTDPNLMEDTGLDLGSSKVAAWTLKIEGRLVDPPYQPKFTTFFKKIIIELKRDPQQFPEGSIIEVRTLHLGLYPLMRLTFSDQWHKQPSVPEHDGFEIKGVGDSDVPVRILLYLDNIPEKAKLSHALGSLLDIHTDTVANIVAAMWKYIKESALCEAASHFHADFLIPLGMYQIFGMPKIAFPQLPDLIRQQLLPADPIVLDYTIRVDREFNVHQQSFDVEIEIEDPIRDRIKAAVAPPPHVLRDIAVLDEKISHYVQQINQAKVRRDFMEAFSRDPVGFLNQWVASQSRDLELILGDTRTNGEETRRSDFYQSEAVREALFHYLRQHGSVH